MLQAPTVMCSDGSRTGIASSRGDFLPRGREREQSTADLREDARERVYSTGISDCGFVVVIEAD